MARNCIKGLHFVVPVDEGYYDVFTEKVALEIHAFIYWPVTTIIQGSGYFGRDGFLKLWRANFNRFF